MQIEVVRSAKYYKAYKKHTPLVLATVKEALPFLEQEFPLVDFSRIEIVIRPLPAKNNTGMIRYVWGKATIELDCRMATVARILDTLAHEITHAEQYQTGRLKWDTDPNSDEPPHFRPRCWIWDQGGKIKAFGPSAGSTYKAYRALPWEVEAFARGAEFAAKYSKRIAG